MDRLPQTVIDSMCEQAAQGETLVNIAANHNTSVVAISRRMARDSLFSELFDAARDVGYDVLADRLLHIHEEHENVHVARLQSDNIKWLLARRKRKVYGDKFELDVTHTVRIDSALAEAKARVVRPVRDQLDIVEAQVVEEKVRERLPAPDLISDAPEIGDADEDVWT